MSETTTLHEHIQAQARDQHTLTADLSSIDYAKQMGRREGFVNGREPMAKLLMEAREFMDHNIQCSFSVTLGRPCVCGYADLLSKINKLIPNTVTE